MADFQKKFDFESRCSESRRIREKYEGRVPVIVTRSPTEKIIPDVVKRKYLVPTDLSIAQFMYVIRKRINLTSDKSLFLFVGYSDESKKCGALVPTARTLGQVDGEFTDPDGFLYITYTGESTFGLATGE